MKSLCVIPVFNEYNRLNVLIDQIKKNSFVEYKLKYIFINNGSTDNSLELIKKSGIKFLSLKKNKGVGYALMLGFLFAKKYKYDFLIHLAGNGKMKPSQIDRFMSLLFTTNYDFISGSRFLNGSSRENNPLIRIVLIKIYTYFIRIVFKKKITDASCGFRAFRINIFKDFKKKYFKKRLFTYGYEYYTFGKILNSINVKFKEVPVSMDYPSKTNYSKIKPVFDWYIIVKYWILGLLTKEKL